MFLYLQWFVDNDPTKPGQLVLFRTVPKNKVTTIKAGGSIMALQEQDTIGKVRNNIWGSQSQSCNRKDLSMCTLLDGRYKFPMDPSTWYPFQVVCFLWYPGNMVSRLIIEHVYLNSTLVPHATFKYKFVNYLITIYGYILGSNN